MKKKQSTVRKIARKIASGIAVAASPVTLPFLYLARKSRENRLRFRSLSHAGRMLDREMKEADKFFASTYEGAKTGRLFKEWGKKKTSADAAIVADTPALNARARAAVRDYGVAKSVVGAYRRIVVGKGITSKAAATDPDTGEPLEAFNRRSNSRFTRWSRDPLQCDLNRQRTLLGHERLWIGDYVTVGQSFCLPSIAIDERGRPRLVLQSFEAEQLAWDLWQSAAEAKHGNSILGGIEVDSFGTVVAFHFHIAKHPYDAWNSASVRIPRERIRHFVDLERARQTHGVSLFAPVLFNLHTMRMHHQYETIRRRMESCIGVILTTDAGNANPWGLDTGTSGDQKDTNDNDQLNFEPGMGMRLKPGESVTAFEPKAIRGAYESFVMRGAVEIAAGTGLDYAAVMRDYTKHTYSGLRLGRNEIEDECDPIQEEMISHMLRPTREQWTEVEILAGRLPAPEFAASDDWTLAYLSQEWRGPRRRSIDPAKDAAAEKILFGLARTTLRGEYNKDGEDWQADGVDQVAAENDYCDDKGVDSPHRTAKQGTAAQEPRPERETTDGNAIVNRILEHAVTSDE